MFRGLPQTVDQQPGQQGMQDLHDPFPEEQPEKHATPPRDAPSQQTQGFLKMPDCVFDVPAFEGQFALLPFNTGLFVGAVGEFRRSLEMREQLSIAATSINVSPNPTAIR